MRKFLEELASNDPKPKPTGGGPLSDGPVKKPHRPQTGGGDKK